VSEPDIVAELDRWLDDWRGMHAAEAMVQRARDEIVALRKHEVGGTIRANSSTISTARSFALKYLGSICGFKNPEEHTTEWFERAMAVARAEALEKAADRVANYFANCDEAVAYIRALKDKR
jgi:hypothetical protein